MVVIFRIITLGLIALGIVSFIRAIISGIITQRRLSKMKRMRELMSDTLKWAEEITDPEVKNEYLKFCVSNLQSISKSLDEAVKFDVEGHRNEIIRKYANHIPSLKQEVRDMKLKQLLG